MKNETVQHLCAEQYKRSTDVHHLTFEKMLEVVERNLRDFGREQQHARRIDGLPSG